MDARIEIRRAEPADAHGIAIVHVQGWREAYAHLVPAESLARLSVPQREQRWNELIAGSTTIYVATTCDGIVGFAGTSVGHSGAPADLELESLYLLASHYGSGAGQRLLDAAVADDPAWLWVAEDNPRARAFYARNRFAADGVTDTHSLAGTPVRAIRMVR
jgi:ribosomal protein S18 acetylase RimI-like enzyme